MSRRAIAARGAYALAFTVVVPALLVAWASILAVDLPALESFWPGVSIALAGVFLSLGAMLQLLIQGRGLPMNAFPPPRLVTTGLYAAVRHPIYLGFVLACAGASLAAGSAAGLWVITPIAALGCVTLVVGFEKLDLERRFGEAARWRPWLGLPPPGETAPLLRERLAVWFTVLLPWLIAYEAVLFLGQPPDAVDPRFDAESSWPVWQWTEAIYASAYLVVPLAVFAVRTRTRLRTFALQGLTATGVVTLIYVCVPFISPPRSFTPEGPLGKLLFIEQQASLPPVAAWPAFHALWSAIAAEAFASRSRRWAAAAWPWAAAVSLSCVTTGMHAVADVTAAWLFYWPLRHRRGLWRLALDAGERLANSWRAWRVGKVRIINHAVFAGAAAALGMLGMGVLAGPAALPGLILVAACSLVGAALWAQIVEGSPRLSRPFGYYGSIAGGLLGGVLSAVFLGQPASLILGAAGAMAPWIQAIGRLRCLVQGCCHGSPTTPENGIRVRNAHSRAVQLAGLAGVPIHATQLYSIAGNLAIGALLLRLWFLQAPLFLIAGLYVILAGLARFMEEAYRGEPQTRILWGLPIYQHLSVLSVLGGMALSVLPAGPAPDPSSLASSALWAASLGAGLIYGFAMGADFPESQRRFARLSG